MSTTTIAVAGFCGFLGIVLLLSGQRSRRSKSRMGHSERREQRHGPLLAGQLQAAGLHIRPVVFVMTALLLGLVSALVVAQAFSNVVVAVAFAAVTLVWPWTFVRYRVRRHHHALAEAMPEVVQCIIRELAANKPIDEAVEIQAVKGPVEMRPYFSTFRANYRLTGDFAGALRRMVKEPIGLSEIDKTVETLIIAQPRGGTAIPIEVLRELDKSLRDDRERRMKILAAMHRNLLVVKLGLVIPWVGLFFFTRQNPSVLQSPGATGVMLLTLAMGALGYVSSRYLMKLPTRRRVWANSRTGP